MQSPPWWVWVISILLGLFVMLTVGIPLAVKIINYDNPTIDFTVDPKDAIEPGQPATLRWRFDGVDTVTIDPLGERPSRGSEVVTPTTTAVYKLVVSTKKVHEERAIRVVVRQPANQPPTVSSAPVR